MRLLGISTVGVYDALSLYYQANYPDTVVDVISNALGCNCESVLAEGRNRRTVGDTVIFIAQDLTGKSDVL